jgi:hypothetical protein
MGDFNVEVVHGGKSHGCCSATNISVGGMFLSGLEKKANERDFLTLKTHYEIASKPSVFERRAMVVHSSDNGLGLMWVDTQSDFLAIINIMNEIAA